MLYEALYFGLPVFVATQAMPYIGLQCKPFVALTDADADADQLNADLSAFVAALADSARRGANFSDPRKELTNRHEEPVQVAIRVYVERELLTMKVYENLCARLGLCDPVCFRRSATPWAKGKCARKDLRRFENWKTTPWDTSKALKHPLRVTSDSKDHCYAKNAHNNELFKGFPWWSPDLFKQANAAEAHADTAHCDAAPRFRPRAG